MSTAKILKDVGLLIWVILTGHLREGNHSKKSIANQQTRLA